MAVDQAQNNEKIRKILQNVINIRVEYLKIHPRVVKRSAKTLQRNKEMSAFCERNGDDANER